MTYHSANSGHSVETYRFWGQLAFAKGIDRSPSHDRSLMASVANLPNARQLGAIHAWESGWDEARQMQRELALERLPLYHGQRRRHQLSRQRINPENKET